MPMGERGGSRPARYELLKVVLNTDSAAPLVCAYSELSCTLRGSVPPRRSVGTCAVGANTNDLLPDVVIFTGEIF